MTLHTTRRACVAAQRDVRGAGVRAAGRPRVPRRLRAAHAIGGIGSERRTRRRVRITRRAEPLGAHHLAARRGSRRPRTPPAPGRRGTAARRAARTAALRSSSSSWVPCSTTPAPVDHEDHVGLQDRGEPVGDRDRRAALHQRLERGLHEPLARRCRASTSPRRGSGCADPSGSRGRSRGAASRRRRACSRARPRRCRSPRAARRCGRGCWRPAPRPRALPAIASGRPYSRLRRIVVWNRYVSCVTTPMLSPSDSSVTPRTSCPSIVTEPCCTS